MRAAVFLDRDGVINRNVFYPDTGAYESPRNADAFELFPDAIPSIRLLQDAGFALFLVSNQPNVAKAKSTLRELEEIQEKLKAALDQAAIHFTEFYYCFHHPDSTVEPFGGRCECRKPSPFFLLKAAAYHGIDLGNSWMVGDRLSDIQCGKSAGVRTVLIVPNQDGTPGSTLQADANFVADGLQRACRIVLDNVKGTP